MAKRPKAETEPAQAPDQELAAEQESAAAIAAAAPLRAAKLEPIGTVRRTLVRPDGSKIAVDVPIYPPFRLENGEPAPQAPKPPRRPRAGAKPRPTGSD